MATGRTVFKHARVYADGYDLSGFIRSFGPLKHEYEAVDMTCPMADAMQGFLPGHVSMGIGTLNSVLDTTATELITNGSMEADANWADVGPPATNERSSAQAYAGTYSRKFTPDAANEGIQGDAFTTVTGETYNVTAYVYPDDTTTVTITVRDGANGADVYDTGHTGLTQDAWNAITFSYTETTGGAGAYIKFDSGAVAAGDWYIDGVSILHAAPLHGPFKVPAARNILVPIGMRAAPAEGDVAYMGNFEQLAYQGLESGGAIDVTIPFGEWNVANLVNYDRPWGYLLHENSAETAANTAVTTVPDYGSNTTAGGYMVYHVFAGAGVGGTATIKVQHSITTNINASYSDLGGCTSGVLDMSQPRSGIVATTATSTTVGRWLRWELTLGTATSVTFALGFVRGI